MLRTQEKERKKCEVNLNAPDYLSVIRKNLAFKLLNGFTKQNEQEKNEAGFPLCLIPVPVVKGHLKFERCTITTTRVKENSNPGSLQLV